MSAYALLVVFTVAISVANLLLRYGLRSVSRPGLAALVAHALRSWAAWTGGLLYAGSTVLWLAVLSSVDLGLAYPIYIGGSFALVYLASFLVLGEPFDLPSAIGALLVFVGIAIAA